MRVKIGWNTMKKNSYKIRNFLFVFGFIILWASPIVLVFSQSSKPQIYVGMNLLKQSQRDSDIRSR